jgi:hypothetical protein
MKKIQFLLAIAVATIVFTAGTVTAQSKNILNAQEILIVKGKLIVDESNQSVGNSNISFNNFGKELLLADLDADGNYLLVFDKEQLEFPVRMTFNIEGYEKFTAKKITAKDEYVKMDIVLTPSSEETAKTPAAEKPVHKWTSTSVVSTTILKLD